VRLPWGSPIKTGTFENSAVPAPIKFTTPPVGQFLKIVALSEVNDKNFTTIAEINIIGCYESATNVASQNIIHEVKAFPVPTNGAINLSVPVSQNLNYSISSITGQVLKKGEINNAPSQFSFDLTLFKAGVYFINMVDESGVVYRAKVVKN